MNKDKSLAEPMGFCCFSTNSEGETQPVRVRKGHLFCGVPTVTLSLASARQA